MTAVQFEALPALARSQAPGFQVGAETQWEDDYPVTVFVVVGSPGAEEASNRISDALVLRCLAEDWPVDFAVVPGAVLPPAHTPVASLQRRSEARR